MEKGVKRLRRILSLFVSAALVVCSFTVGTPVGVMAESEDTETMISDQGNGEEPVSVMLLSFDSCGGSPVESQELAVDVKPVNPKAPVKDGFFFGGWYYDPGYMELFDFDIPLFEDTTVYAKWIEKGIVVDRGSDQYRYETDPKTGERVLKTVKGSGNYGCWILYDNGVLELRGNKKETKAEKTYFPTDSKIAPDKGWHKYNVSVNTIISTEICDLVEDWSDQHVLLLSNKNYNVILSDFYNLDTIIAEESGVTKVTPVREDGRKRFGNKSDQVDDHNVIILDGGINPFTRCYDYQNKGVYSDYAVFPNLTDIFFTVEKEGDYTITDEDLPIYIKDIPAKEIKGSFGSKENYYRCLKKETDRIAEKNAKGKELFNKAVKHYNFKSLPVIPVSFNRLDEGGTFRKMAVEGAAMHSLPVLTRISDNETYYTAKWYRDESLTDEFKTDDRVVSGLTLYAGWEPSAPVDVNFYYSGRNSDEKEELYKTVTVYQGEYVRVPEDPVKEGYDFIGWNTDTVSGDFSFRKRVTDTEPVSVYAEWRKKGFRTAHFSNNRNGEADKNNRPLVEFEFDYTDSVEYDGRKHVWDDGKTKESLKKNPDIKIENLKVFVGDSKEPLPGFSIKSVKYTNNRNAVFGNPSNPMERSMYMFVTLNIPAGTDSSVKKELKKMCKFKKKCDVFEEPEGEMWSLSLGWKGYCDNEAPHVDIRPVVLVSENMVFTKSEVDSDSELKNKDGILIWNGSVKVSWKNGKKYDQVDGKYKLVSGKFAAKAVLGKLSLQKVYDINGQKTVKLLPLKSGSWKFWKGDFRENYIDKNSDYYIRYISLNKGDEKVSIIYDRNLTGTLGVIKRPAQDIAKDPSNVLEPEKTDKYFF